MPGDIPNKATQTMLVLSEESQSPRINLRSLNSATKAALNQNAEPNYNEIIEIEHVGLQEDVAAKCTIKISGMTCASCVANIERNMEKVDGIRKIVVALITGKADVKYDPSHILPPQIAKKIEDLGYGAEVIGGDSESGQVEFLVCLSRILQ